MCYSIVDLGAASEETREPIFPLSTDGRDPLKGEQPV